MIYLILSILLLPLSNALLCFVGGKNFKQLDKYSFISLLLSFVTAIFLFANVWRNEEMNDFHYSYNWLHFGDIHLSFGVYLDKLSSLLLLLITLISSLVHLFSLSYMQHDTYYYRYWGYLGLFCFAMLGIVVSDNLLMLFMFWELVGLSSYFLIGFWFQKDKPARASQKAFLVNRIGDVGFLAGILCCFANVKTFDIQLIAQNFHTLSPSLQTLIGLLIFGGAMGKSAQFPLQIWLPDAMEGPTPVSSLIHAATMVAAGVYLTARISPILTPDALIFIAFIGAITALMAALAALTQTDIKRVLAYSTVSQLGLMITALGVGAYDYALFHLITHAFFKCGLFLAAAIIIHEIQHQLDNEKITSISAQDLTYMGGLKKYLPITFYATAICMLGLIGMPFFSGFLSKEGILEAVFQFSWKQGKLGLVLGAMVWATSLLTPYYMVRHFSLIFLGENRLQKYFPQTAFHFHEANWKMWLPVSITAFFTLFFVYSFNPFSAENSWLLRAFSSPKHSEHLPYHFTLFASLLALSLGAGMAYYQFISKKNAPNPQQKPSLLQRISQQHFYQDAAYTRLIAHPFLVFCELFATFDKKIVDGFVNFFGKMMASQPKVLAFLDHEMIDGAVNFVGNEIADQPNVAKNMVMQTQGGGTAKRNISFDKYVMLAQNNQAKSGKSLAYWAGNLDKYIIDGAVNGVASVIQRLSKSIRRMQNGNTQNYLLLGALAFFLLLGGIVGIAFYFKGKTKETKNKLTVLDVPTLAPESMPTLLLQVAKADTAYFSPKTALLNEYQLELNARITGETEVKVNAMLEEAYKITAEEYQEAVKLMADSSFNTQLFTSYTFLPYPKVSEIQQKHNLKTTEGYANYWKEITQTFGVESYNAFGKPFLYRKGSLALIIIGHYRAQKSESYIVLYEKVAGKWQFVKKLGQAF
ncbi:MAG: NADH-quinone oxidoreductase subunit L [Bacteroidia bacterium]